MIKYCYEPVFSVYYQLYARRKYFRSKCLFEGSKMISSFYNFDDATHWYEKVKCQNQKRLILQLEKEQLFFPNKSDKRRSLYIWRKKRSSTMLQTFRRWTEEKVLLEFFAFQNQIESSNKELKLCMKIPKKEMIQKNFTTIWGINDVKRKTMPNMWISYQTRTEKHTVGTFRQNDGRLLIIRKEVVQLENNFV